LPIPEVTAFVDPEVPGAAESLRRHATQITTVALTGLLLGDDGSVVDRLDQRMLRLAQNEGLRTMALLQNIDEQDGSWRPDRVRALAHDRSARQRLAEQLVRLCAAQHLQGIHLDLERARDSRDLEPIAADIQRALRREQLELQIDVPPGIDAPLAALARVSSGIVVMAYDEHDANSPAGPVASDAFVESALRSAAALVPAAKLTAALALHGYEWVSGEAGHRISFDQAQVIARQAQVEVRRNGSNLHVQFRDGDRNHEVWLADTESVRGQARIAAATNIHSLALWRLGGEDPEIWPALRERRTLALDRAMAERRADGDKNTTSLLQSSNWAFQAPSQSSSASNDRRGARSALQTSRPAPRIANDLSIETRKSGSAQTGPATRMAGRRPVSSRNRVGEDEHGLTLSAPFPFEREPPTPKRSTVALVFEGGPDPLSTPHILDELAQQHAPATFIVRGAQALREPELIERIFREGHALGNGGFTYTSIGRISDTRLRLELEVTSRLIELLVRRRPLLFRAPTPATDPSSTAMNPALETVAALGYIVDRTARPTSSTLSDADEMVRQALVAGRRSGVIVLRDDPSHRVPTLRALTRIVAQLRTDGMQLVPLANVLGKQRDEVMPPAPRRVHIGERLTSFLLANALAVSRVLPLILWLSLGLFVARALVMMTLAIVSFGRVPEELPPSPLPSVTALIPVFNAMLSVEQTIDSVLASDIPLDVVIIDDGSTDGTAEQLSQRYRREPRVRLLRQAHAGKAAALLTGFAACKTEVIVTLDPGTLFATDTARNLVEPLRDPSVGAVSGTAQVGNADNALCRWQALESLIHQEIGQRAWDLVGALQIVPSTMGAWRRRAVVEVGGFSSTTLAADLDLTMALCSRGWRIVHAARARAHVEAPTALGTLIRQRIHSSFGILQALWRHRPVANQPESRRHNRRGWLALLFIEVLMPLSALPALGAAALATLAGDFQPALHAGLVLFAVELAQLAVAVLFAGRSGGGSTARLLLSLVTSQLVYRPLRLAIVLRSIGRLVDGIPIGAKPSHRSAAMAYATATRALARR
jgi:spore germination protein YaaH/peptidoglycan/xylan/chitin deacetylase (PgdA/CDA1 family)